MKEEKKIKTMTPQQLKNKIDIFWKWILDEGIQDGELSLGDCYRVKDKLINFILQLHKEAVREVVKRIRLKKSNLHNATIGKLAEEMFNEGYNQAVADLEKIKKEILKEV